MGGLFATLKDTAMRPMRTAMSNIVEDVIEFALIGILAMLAIGFGIGAIYIWLSQKYGELYAALIMAGVFLVLAIFVFVVRAISSASRRKKAERERREVAEKISQATHSALDIATLIKAVGVGRGGSASRDDARGSMAARVAHSVTSQVSPWTLVGISILAGFVGGRKLGD